MVFRGNLGLRLPILADAAILRFSGRPRCRGADGDPIGPPKVMRKFLTVARWEKRSACLPDRHTRADPAAPIA
jgi:hypothetical protein